MGSSPPPAKSLTDKKINVKNVERGKYFRIVARVEADGQDVSDFLIQEGFAVVYDGGTKEKGWCE
ncbi:MAG: thermonuclease family protein [Nitrospinae bacterium]|nr:thermonuclease family protein [Nitrospinota bacterium]